MRMVVGTTWDRTWDLHNSALSFTTGCLTKGSANHRMSFLMTVQTLTLI